jgi:hypothetical protein
MIYLYHVIILDVQLYNISNLCNNKIIILGGYAKKLEFNIKDYDKKEIDIYIDTSNINELSNLDLSEMDNDFPYPIIKRFIGFYDDYFLDVFVSDRVPIYKMKNGLKYATIEDDIEYFNLMYKNSNNEYFLNKLNENIKRLSRFI